MATFELSIQLSMRWSRLWVSAMAKLARVPGMHARAVRLAIWGAYRLSWWRILPRGRWQRIRLPA